MSTLIITMKESWQQAELQDTAAFSISQGDCVEHILRVFRGSVVAFWTLMWLASALRICCQYCLSTVVQFPMSNEDGQRVFSTTLDVTNLCSSFQKAILLPLIVQGKEEVGRETPFLNRQVQMTAQELSHTLPEESHEKTGSEKEKTSENVTEKGGSMKSSSWVCSVIPDIVNMGRALQELGGGTDWELLLPQSRQISEVKDSPQDVRADRQSCLRMPRRNLIKTICKRQKKDNRKAYHFPGMKATSLNKRGTIPSSGRTSVTAHVDIHDIRPGTILELMTGFRKGFLNDLFRKLSKQVFLAWNSKWKFS